MHSSPLPASFSTLPPLLNPPSSSSSSPFLSSLHPSWSYFDSGLSLFHPPSSQPQPFSSQPQFPIDLLIAVCLWESGRSLPLSLCSPLHGFVFPFPLLSSPSPSSPSPSPHRCSSSETWITESRGVQFTGRNQIHLLLRSFLLFLPHSPLPHSCLSPPFSGASSVLCFCQSIVSVAFSLWRCYILVLMLQHCQNILYGVRLNLNGESFTFNSVVLNGRKIYINPPCWLNIMVFGFSGRPDRE